MQPTIDDVNMVAQSMGFPQPTAAPAPTPVPEPVAQPMQQQPVQQPVPQAPVAPAEPLYTPGIQGAPQQFGTEPVAPQSQQTPQPQPQQPAPAAPVQQPGAPEAQPQAPQPPVPQQSYEEFVNQALASIPEPAPAPALKDVDTNDAESVDKFFSDFKQSIVSEMESASRRKETIANIERQGWDEAFNKYPDLRSNMELRNAVMNYRVGNHTQGKFLSPSQAADQLLGFMGNQYQQGIADNQVQTNIESAQPTGGGSQAPATVVNPIEELKAVQDGGEIALAQVIANRIDNGLM